VIIVEMEGAGLDRNFIVAAFELARSDQGVYEIARDRSRTASHSEWPESRIWGPSYRL
jgi:hypothetical protein